EAFLFCPNSHYSGKKTDYQTNKQKKTNIKRDVCLHSEHSVDPSVFCYRFAFFLEKWYNYLIKNFGDDSEFRKLHARFCLGKGL
ncbi:hypothetical protein, partial [Streptococcus suis]